MISHNMNWAIKFLQRWQQFPETHKDMEDPLSTLECIVTAPAVEDAVNRRFHARVLMPVLGLRGTLNIQNPTDVEVGGILPVKISELRAGLVPRIGVSRR